MNRLTKAATGSCRPPSQPPSPQHLPFLLNRCNSASRSFPLLFRQFNLHIVYLFGENGWKCILKYKTTRPMEVYAFGPCRVLVEEGTYSKINPHRMNGYVIQGGKCLIKISVTITNNWYITKSLGNLTVIPAHLGFLRVRLSRYDKKKACVKNHNFLATDLCCWPHPQWTTNNTQSDHKTLYVVWPLWRHIKHARLKTIRKIVQVDRNQHEQKIWLIPTVCSAKAIRVGKLAH